MPWLWALAPLVIVAGALWLAIGTRRLAQSRLMGERELDAGADDLRAEEARLRGAVDRVAVDRDADPSAGPRDR